MCQMDRCLTAPPPALTQHGPVTISRPKSDRGLSQRFVFVLSAHHSRAPHQVFYATGTLLTRCNGRWSTDGGVSNNGPAFTDAPTRPQLLVDPTKSGLPLRMAFQFTVEQFTAAVQLGQDDTVRLWEAQEGDQMPAALSWIGAAAAEK